MNLPPQPKHTPLEQTHPFPRITPAFPVAKFGWSLTLEQMQKSHKAIQQWQHKESIANNATKRYNKALVQQLTGISDKDIEPFMKFCQLKPEVVAKCSDYELGETIKKCYMAYQEQSKGH